MNNQLDELAKGLAQSVTRRAALRRFGLGLAGIALASLGLTHKAEAKHKLPSGKGCNHCRYPYGCDALPPNQQSGCILYCNSLCG